VRVAQRPARASRGDVPAGAVEDLHGQDVEADGPRAAAEAHASVRGRARHEARGAQLPTPGPETLVGDDRLELLGAPRLEGDRLGAERCPAGSAVREVLPGEAVRTDDGDRERRSAVGRRIPPPVDVRGEPGACDCRRRLVRRAERRRQERRDGRLSSGPLRRRAAKTEADRDDREREARDGEDERSARSPDEGRAALRQAGRPRQDVLGGKCLHGATAGGEPDVAVRKAGKLCRPGSAGARSQVQLLGPGHAKAILLPQIQGSLPRVP
jgi:hypothetical protein